MTTERAGQDTTKFKMKPKPGSPPGLELDQFGNVIPLAERTEEDRAVAIAAGETDASLGKASAKTETEHPS